MKGARSMTVRERRTHAYQPTLPLWQPTSNNGAHGGTCDAHSGTRDARPIVSIDTRNAAWLTSDGPPPARVDVGDARTMTKTVIYTHDNLPGPFALRTLTVSGILIALDDDHAFLRADGETLYGRAAIVASVLPNRRLVACGRTAAWVWLGGDFPSVIDALSAIHYRAPILGRPIHVRERRVPPNQTKQIGPLIVTTPERTICDLAMCTQDEIYDESLDERILQLLRQFRVDVQDCLLILEGCSYLHTAQRAREVIADFSCIA